MYCRVGGLGAEAVPVTGVGTACLGRYGSVEALTQVVGIDRRYWGRFCAYQDLSHGKGRCRD